uniref:hypothetical protein n=1 Tax=Cephaleuros karstenii TaxID=1985640 RepID=UPI001EDFF680|nr:hypothetical protein MFR52_pgp017 [Cephaleuros karstenii]UIB39142.1 hypothetical protein [Cephaleuros karstenii]
MGGDTRIASQFDYHSFRIAHSNRGERPLFEKLKFYNTPIGIYSLANYFTNFGARPKTKTFSLFIYEGDNLMPLKFHDVFNLNFKDINLISKFSSKKKNSNEPNRTRDFIFPINFSNDSYFFHQGGALNLADRAEPLQNIWRENKLTEEELFASEKQIHNQGSALSMGQRAEPGGELEKKKISSLPKKAFFFSNKRKLPYNFIKQVP